MSVIAYSHQL